MNQVALSSVLIRLYGLYLLCSTIAQIGSSYLFQQTYYMFDADATAGYYAIGFFSLAVILQIAAGVIMIVLGGKISRLLFPDNRAVIADGSINGEALLYIGVALIGVYFFAGYLPAALNVVFDWFSSNAASNSYGASETEYRDLRSIEYLIMLFVSSVLIFRRKTICEWMGRVAK